MTKPPPYPPDDSYDVLIVGFVTLILPLLVLWAVVAPQEYERNHAAGWTDGTSWRGHNPIEANRSQTGGEQ